MKTTQAQDTVPGSAGSPGPFLNEYGVPHVYARDVYSGAGNCVCGASIGHDRHTEVAPGIPIPARFRHKSQVGS